MHSLYFDFPYDTSIFTEIHADTSAPKNKNTKSITWSAKNFTIKEATGAHIAHQSNPYYGCQKS